MLKDEPTQLKIDFLCNGNYWFNPPKIYEEGVGGAEYIIMFLAEALAKLGHFVTIYNDCVNENTYSGVNYRFINHFDPSEPRHIFVPWRTSYHDPINAGKFVFFSCDQYTDRNWGPMLPRLDKFLCISPFHRDYIIANYPIDPEKVVSVSPGVNLRDYTSKEAKQLKKQRNPNKLIYCSVPDRGLASLAQMWPIIRRRVPEAELVVTSDYTLWGARDPGNQRFLSAIKQPGIIFLGKIPRQELVNHQLTSSLLCYPCNYQENFGIAVAECMAAGAVPVIFGTGAIPTTVQNGGIVLTPKRKPEGLYTPLTIEDEENFIESLCSLLQNPKDQEKYRVRAHSIATREYSYLAMAARFLEAI